VCTNKLDVDRSYPEYNPHNQPVMVTSDIKNIEIIANGIYRVELRSELIKICPIGLFSHCVPIVQRILRVRMITYELPDGFITDNDHAAAS
jgi:hypothetical protein